jgi:rhodanese-related sulfurtransferase
MASSVKDMLAAANSAVPRIQPADLRDRMSKGDVVVVDVRDAPELATGGKIKGAVHVPRGMLEFRADPESPAPQIDPIRPPFVRHIAAGVVNARPPTRAGSKHVHCGKNRSSRSSRTAAGDCSPQSVTSDRVEMAV